MPKRNNLKTLLIGIITLLIFPACSTVGSAGKQIPAAKPITATATETLVANPTMQNNPAASAIATATPQPTSTPASFGPDQGDFPPAYNPLSGQLVKDPQLLQVPAMLVSISHFPPVARPQAGLSFAPWVFEFYITEGATRFLATFYGRYPAPEIPVTGNCVVRQDPFVQTGDVILGKRVWLDKNQNGRMEPYEPGVGGVCVNLYADAGTKIDSTTTDSNGYYGFNVPPGKYLVEFVLPKWLQFTRQNVGDENADSDVDPVTGRVEAEVGPSLLDLNAGLIPVNDRVPTPAASFKAPRPEIGPVRSGRLLYADIASSFESSCLLYAFASPEVLSQIPKCAMVVHEDAGGGSMLPLDRFQAVAEDNLRHMPGGFNYTGNLFTEQPPVGGAPARQINVFVALLNQSGYTYDPLYGAWLRFVDNADKTTAGQLHADVDRLTGRQLHFENFIVLYADHDVISPTNLQIHLEQGSDGPAALFRDGMQYDIRWSTKAGDYEKQTGERRPIKFLNPDGSPAALKPGASWIFVATPYSALSDEGGGVWQLRYYPPNGSK